MLLDLRNDPETRDIPIIICSILEEEEKGFSLGVADYLFKPFLQENIIKAITRLDREGTINKVLVIDDDPADLRLVQKILEDMKDYNVQEILLVHVDFYSPALIHFPSKDGIDHFFSRISPFQGIKHLGGMQTSLLGLGELLVKELLANWWLG